MSQRAPRRDPWDDEHRLELVEGRVDANTTDLRVVRRDIGRLSDRTREGFQHVNLRLDTIGQRLDAVSTILGQTKSKASGAHHKAVQLEARQSKTEEQIRSALDEAAAKSKAIVANPPEGAELDELKKEFLKAAKPHVPRVTWAVVAFILAALGYATAALYSCSPGGLP